MKVIKIQTLGWILLLNNDIILFHLHLENYWREIHKYLYINAQNDKLYNARKSHQSSEENFNINNYHVLLYY